MKKLISLCLAAATLVSSCFSVAAAADDHATETAEVSEVQQTEAAIDDGTAADEEFVGTVTNDDGAAEPEAEVTESVSADETVEEDLMEQYNNPILTPEEAERGRAYEERLRSEMEAEGAAGEVSLFDTDMPTYAQYLADWEYKDGEGKGYNLYAKDLSLPYRSYVETRRYDATFNGLLTAWRIATFELSDIQDFSTKEIGFYESILYDILYQGIDTTSIAGSLEKGLDTLYASSVKDMAEYQGMSAASFLKRSIKELDQSAQDTLKETISQSKYYEDVFGAVSDIGTLLTYADTVEEIVYKIAKAQVISENNNETAKILIRMKDSTTSPAMQYALTNMIAICSEVVSEESVIAMIVSNDGTDLILKESLDFVWDGVLDHLGTAGIAVSAGQAAGKILTDFLFSTDAEIEMYYELCALYDFEDVLKSALFSFESSYRSSASDANASVFMQAYKMLLQTHLLGIKGSQDYLDSYYKNGLVNQILLLFREDEYEEYKEQLESIKECIEDKISFLEVTAYNMYVEEFNLSNADDIIALEVEPEKYTEEQKDEILSNTQALSYKLGNITITDGMTMTEDIETYGSVYLKGGILDINGHTLDIGGDFIIANGTAVDTAGETHYVAADARIRMTDYRDKVIVNGDFITYGEDHSGCLT
ncbi:MAG TPA: hypothetical protein IAA61_08120, partial [Candidatus Ornithomonoglobus merdipullorum]|nr:hypothetical protein [Candidatus Ornithomonoglobus merdipullorum]